MELVYKHKSYNIGSDIVLTQAYEWYAVRYSILCSIELQNNMKRRQTFAKAETNTMDWYIYAIYSKNHFGTSGPQTARLSSPAFIHPTGVSSFTKSPSA